MCELLVRIEDKSSDPDPLKDAWISKKGHVIVVCPDGWGWSAAELTNPAWRIGSIPGMSPDDYAKFIGPAGYTNETGPTRVARKAFYLDVDQLAASGAWRSGEIRTFSPSEIDAATIATEVVPPIPVIG